MALHANGFLAIDWGTTNRRVYALAADGAVEAVDEGGAGVLEPPADGFAAEVARMREAHAGRPALLAGMIGSNRGWAEVPYVALPAGPAEIAAGALRVSEGVAIVPGLAQRHPRADVLRGEEVQAMGAVAGGWAAPDATLCHPGTHSKWITLRGGRVTAFRTAITGELFALLRASGILAPQLAGEVVVGEAFTRGVADALAGEPLTAALFGVRARALLEGAQDGASYTSGLLIGADVAGARPDGPVVLVGRPDLNALYAAALAHAGVETTEIDGGEAFLAGMRALEKLL